MYSGQAAELARSCWRSHSLDPQRSRRTKSARKTPPSDEGNVTGGDVSELGVAEMPAEMQARNRDKARVAEAYVESRLTGLSGDYSNYESELRAYEEKWGIELDQGLKSPLGAPFIALAGEVGAGPSLVPAVNPAYTKRLLGVPHFGQINGYFCGPGAGKMILKYLGEGVSAYNGAPQNQGRIGGAGHMRTWENGKTGWPVEDSVLALIAGGRARLTVIMTSGTVRRLKGLRTRWPSILTKISRSRPTQ